MTKISVMRRITTVILFSFLPFLISCGTKTVLKDHKIISSYPSASGIEFLKDKYYVIGDDANNLLILDNQLIPVDSFALFSFSEKRIPKDLKADLEAATLTHSNKLLLIGSGSLSPARDFGWLIDPATRTKDSLDLQPFFNQLRLSGIKEINIEGLASIPGGMLLANRGNKGYPKNYLILTSPDFWKNPATAPISIISAGGSSDSTLFNGVSGLTYSSRTDCLIMTVSTEDTRNAMDDGEIGKSYLWIIKNISSKKRWKAINPDQIVDLQSIDPAFEKQKIESVCLVKETNNFFYLVLAADNDNGSSSLFNMIVEKD